MGKYKGFSKFNPDLIWILWGHGQGSYVLLVYVC